VALRCKLNLTKKEAVMKNGIVGIRQSALRSALANGGHVNAITPEMRQKMQGRLVVFQKNGKTVIVSGGLYLGVADGTEMSTAEFSRNLPIGVQCIHNPKFNHDGSMNMSTKQPSL